MSGMPAQPGVLAPLSAFGCSLAFRCLPDADLAGVLNHLKNEFDPAWGVVGIGMPVFSALGSSLPGLREFPALSGPGGVVPSTQQALWVFVQGDDRSTTFERAEAVTALLAKGFELVDAVDTFKYKDGRDLTGYEDGTENPGPEESVDVALVNSDQPGLKCSSFVSVQRWQHDLAGFQAHSQSERDAMVGRRLADNEEIDDAPESAHVKRSAQESFDPEAFMVRRSMPWVSGNAKGLEFIAYGASLDAFEQIMQRMLGLADGIADALFRFSKPITGGYYWCPPIAGNRLDFSLIV